MYILNRNPSINKVVRVIKSLFNHDKLCDMRKSTVLFIRHDANLNYSISGKKYCTLLGGMQEWCIKNDVSFISLSKPYSLITRDESWDSGHLINRGFLFSDLKHQIFKLIFNKIINFRAELWTQYLNKISPEVIISIRPDTGLASAANKLGIELIEMQHGVIDFSHWWYGKKSANELSPQELPSIYFCWNDYSANVIKSWGVKKNKRVYVVGHPWLNHSEQADQDMYGVKRLQNRPRILVSLQPYIESDGANPLDDELVAAIKSTSHKYSWAIRLHPLQLETREKFRIDSYLNTLFGSLPNVEWEKASKVSLPRILSETDLHITRYSSVIIEASMLGVVSIALSPHLRPTGKYGTLFSSEREAGLVLLRDKNFELEKQIEGLLAQDHMVIRSDSALDSPFRILGNIIQISEERQH